MTPTIIKKLKSAYCSEKLAAQMYHYFATVCVGPNSESAVNHFLEHEKEEESHAKQLEERLYQLDQRQEFNPGKWTEIADCPYPTESPEDVLTICEIIIESEECAIENYTKLLSETEDIDPVTNNIIIDILSKETEHKTDISKIYKSVEIFYENDDDDYK